MAGDEKDKCLTGNFYQDPDWAEEVISHRNAPETGQEVSREIQDIQDIGRGITKVKTLKKSPRRSIFRPATTPKDLSKACKQPAKAGTSTAQHAKSHAMQGQNYSGAGLTD